MNRHCHNCGKEWELDGLPGRSESCHGCNEDLRICLNCVFHDSSAAYQCRERRAEPVTEKNRSNFCEYFDFVFREWSGSRSVSHRIEESRKKFEQLFGN
ncbi:MAG: hypothetical protein VYE44_04050 [Verrucomicrobiota bacterium]|nr:hypothetical protein [Verrucomicrobiota bacterium]